MRKISVYDRIIFLIIAHIAGIKIVSGMEQYSVWATASYTIAFGVLVLASAMLLLFGFELLQNRFVPVISTLIPMMLSLGLVQDYLPAMIAVYASLLALLYFVSIWARFKASPYTAAMVLAMVHGISGLLLFTLPLVLYLNYDLPSRLLFISIGGLVIGVEGTLMTLQKLNIIRVDQNLILAMFPGVLLVSISAFIVGLK